MGLLAGALATGIQQSANVVNQQAGADIAQSQKIDLAKEYADIEAQKNQRALEAQSRQADADRQALAARVGQVRGGLLDTAVLKQLPGAGPATPSAANDFGANTYSGAPETAGQDQLDAQRAALRANLEADPHYTVQAGMLTGDVAPKEVAQLTSKGDLAQVRADVATSNAQLKWETLQANWQQKYDTALQIANARASSASERTQAMLLMAGMREELTRNLASNKIDAQNGYKLVQSLNDDIKENQAQIAELNKGMTGLNSTAQKAASAEISKRMTTITDLQARKAAVFDGLGIKGAGASGSPRYVGTSGGKPGYQMPDGSQVIEQAPAAVAQTTPAGLPSGWSVTVGDATGGPPAPGRRTTTTLTTAPSVPPPAAAPVTNAPAAVQSQSAAPVQARSAEIPAPFGADAAPATPGDVPDPPPRTIQQGLRELPNPAFADWEAKFGSAYRAAAIARVAAARARDAEALKAKTSFNPYAQRSIP